MAPILGGVIGGLFGKWSDCRLLVQRIAKATWRRRTGSRDSPTPLASYEKSLADARGRAQALANNRDKLNAEADRPGKRWKPAQRKLAKAEGPSPATKTAAMANVRGIAVDTAAAIVSG